MITLIKEILTQKPEGQEVAVYGWVRTKRETKNLIFIQVNDGSCFASIQLTFDRDKGIDAQTEKELSRIEKRAMETGFIAFGVLVVLALYFVIRWKLM